MKKVLTIAFGCFVFFAIIHFGQSADHSETLDFVRYSAPEFLTFEELVSLSKAPADPITPLHDKLRTLWTTPIISNEAYYSGERPFERVHPKLGPFIRVATWNIELSLEMDQAITAFTNWEGYQVLINQKKFSPSSGKYKRALEERDLLAESDIILLQEMDIGVKRSGYRNAAKDLADALHMNYAYGTAFLEVDPGYLGTESMNLKEGGIDQEAMDYFRVDPERYKGMFGSAVLSRYPIKSVVVFPLRNQGYDWYNSERRKFSFLEKARRIGAEKLIHEEMHREVKVGGRIFMRVDLHVPGLPNDTLTIINVHLEIKCLPKAREAQLKEILGYIQNIDNPVILAGDFNSAPTDLSPTSTIRVVKRKVKDPTLWFSLAVSRLTTHGLILNSTRTVSNFTKNYQDPTARSIPVVAPNITRGLFKAIHDFQFNDGYTFDFRGDPKRSFRHQRGRLANSNQRDKRGFKTTFRLSNQPVVQIIGKYRLDWIFVKSFLKNSKDKRGSYRLAPHFGRTLEEMNAFLKKRISDHHPNIVDLPLNEPVIESR